MRKFLYKIILLNLIFINLSLATNNDSQICSCNYLGNNYFCALGNTLEEAKKNLSQSIFSFVKVTQERILKKQNNNWKEKFFSNFKVESKLPLFNIKISNCNGTYLVYIKKDSYIQRLRNYLNSLLEDLKTKDNLKEFENIKEKVLATYTVLKILNSEFTKDNKDILNILKEKQMELEKKETKKLCLDTEEKFNKYKNELLEGKLSYESFSKKVENLISKLENLQKKIHLCESCSEEINKEINDILENKKKIFKNLEGCLQVVIVNSNNNAKVYINGEEEENNKICDIKEKKLEIFIEGNNNYENRKFTAKLVKGKNIVKKIYLWNLKKLENHQEIGINYFIFNSQLAITYRKYLNFKVPLIRPFFGIKGGYSFKDDSAEFLARSGLEIYKRSQKELLYIKKNKPIFIDSGLGLGHYGLFGDNKYFFMEFFLSPKVVYNYNLDLSLEVNYKIPLSSTDKIQRFNSSIGLNIRF